MPSTKHPVCKCGHDWEAHQHNRPGTECSICATCLRYRPRRGLLIRHPR